jgi:hypothetical protein
LSRAPTSIAREQAERHQFLDSPPPSYPAARTVFREAEPEAVEAEEAVGATEPPRHGEAGIALAPASPTLPDEPPGLHPEPDHDGWRDETPPANVIVLVTDDPDSNPEGIRARWYRRRQFIAGRWVTSESWVHVLNTSPIYPKPQFWKPDPERTRLTVLAS